MNRIRAYFILVITSIILLILGHLIADNVGFFIALVLVVLMFMTAINNASRYFLHLFKAEPFASSQADNVSAIVSKLANEMNLPTPSLHVIDHDAATLFVVGKKPKQSIIVLTSGLLKTISQDELTALMSRSLAEIQFDSQFLNSVIAMMTTSLTNLSKRSTWSALWGNRIDPANDQFIPVLKTITWFIASWFVKMGTVDANVYDADKLGASICGHPEWLISALEKLEKKRIEITLDLAETNPGTSPLFVINPQRDEKSREQFSSHPSVADRILHLKQGK